MKKTFSSRKGLGFSAAAFAVFIVAALASPPAQALEGCNPAVMEAMRAKAQMKVAETVATADEIVKKPDSVLALSCFNQSAGTSAEAGGNIFSGNFTAQLQPIVEDALGSFMDDFLDDTLGGSEFAGALNIISGPPLNLNVGDIVSSAAGQAFSGFMGDIGFSFGGGSGEGVDEGTWNNIIGEVGGLAASYLGSALSTNVSCEGIKGLWDKVKGSGINAQIPQLTFKDLMATNIPQNIVPGSAFEKNWNNIAPLRTRLQNAYQALPTPDIPAAYAEANSSCDVLVAAGILPAGTNCTE